MTKDFQTLVDKYINQDLKNIDLQKIMSRDEILTIVEKAVNACISKNAIAFASLFAQDGEIIMNKNYKIVKADIEKVTADYFSNLEYVKINVHNILIEDNKAFVEWSWEDYNLLSKQKNCHDNVLSIHFQDGLIKSWREYKG